MGIKSYQELDVWQKAVGLVTEIYRIVRDFPREELYCLTNQVQRAANSIPANIAEGWGRSTTKDYIQFLRIARGSLLELETHLIISDNIEESKLHKQPDFRKNFARDSQRRQDAQRLNNQFNKIQKPSSLMPNA